VEGTTSTDLDGFGIGGVISAKATAEKWTFGLVYKSPTRIEFKGDAEFQVPDPVRPLFPNGNARTTQEFPQMVILGVANEPLDGLTMELDLQWTNWDSFDQQTVKFDNRTAAVQNITTTLNWEDTWTVRVGGHYAYCLILKSNYSLNVDSFKTLLLRVLVVTAIERLSRLFLLSLATTIDA